MPWGPSTTRSRQQRSSSSPTCCCAMSKGPTPQGRGKDMDPYAVCRGQVGLETYQVLSPDSRCAGGSGACRGRTGTVVRPGVGQLSGFGGEAGALGEVVGRGCAVDSPALSTQRKSTSCARVFTAAAKRPGRRSAVGTMSEPSMGNRRAPVRSSVRYRWRRVTRFQSLS